jgi:hypothetical protein
MRKYFFRVLSRDCEFYRKHLIGEVGQEVFDLFKCFDIDAGMLLIYPTA